MWTAESVFMCALGLLARSPQSFPPTQLVETAPVGVSRQAAAYIRRGDAHIVLITSTAAFVNARRAGTQCGDLDAIREIAGVLAHEEWHLRHGADEEGAYDAQLTALLFVGAEPDGGLYHKVKQAKSTVLAAARRAAQTVTVARSATPGLEKEPSMMSVPPRDGR